MFITGRIFRLNFSNKINLFAASKDVLHGNKFFSNLRTIQERPVFLVEYKNKNYASGGINKSWLNNFSTSKILTNSYSPKNNRKNYYQKPDQSSKNALWYILSGFVIMVGASYAAVPLFKLFCESQGIDVNTEFREMDLEKLKKKLTSMKKVENRSIKVKFVASTSADLLWKFEPSQEEITVSPGETALAFLELKI